MFPLDPQGIHPVVAPPPPLQVWDALHGNPPTREGFTILPTLLHPRSKGTIRLRSSNPEDTPLINPNYLAEDVDVKILAEGLSSTFQESLYFGLP